jgi:hypothetical protein
VDKFVLLRKTGDDAGHPTGRNVEREEAFALLQRFPSYCNVAYDVSVGSTVHSSIVSPHSLRGGRVFRGMSPFAMGNWADFYPDAPGFDARCSVWMSFT